MANKPMKVAKSSLMFAASALALLNILALHTVTLGASARDIGTNLVDVIIAGSPYKVFLTKMKKRAAWRQPNSKRNGYLIHGESMERNQFDP